MTSKRIEKLKNLIEESRARLLESNPSFAILLMYLRFVAVPSMKKASTNGLTIFFNPQFVEKLHWNELDYVLCHQIMHIVLEHTEAASSLDIDLEDYHFACDVYINYTLYGAGFPLERFTHLGELCCEIPWERRFKVADKTEMEIYDALPLSLSFFDEKTRSRYLVDSHDFWDEKHISKREGTIIIDFPKLDSVTELDILNLEDGASSDGKYNPIDEGVKACVYSALKTTRTWYKKDYKDPLIRALKRRKKPTLDWRKLLIEFLQEEVNDYSFMPPDIRYDDMPFFLPDFNEKDYAIKEILFMVDTSGSITEEQITAAYSEMCGVVEQFNGKIVGKIAFFDSSVYPAVDFQSVRDILEIAPLGGGGTSFDIIFDYVRESSKDRRPGCIVIFTDGEADYPSEESAMGIPVFWIINNSENTPPWGRVARINAKKE